MARWGNYGMMGSNHLKTPNEPNGLEIWFCFKEDGSTPAEITIEDNEGNQMYQQEIAAKSGIRKIYWNNMNATPGDYIVKMSYNGKVITKKGTFTEAWRWPVLNFREQ